MQKLFSSVQGLAHFGPPGFQGFHPHPASLGLLHIAIGPSHKFADLVGRPNHGQSPVETAGRLHQLGSGQIGLVHHHPWGEVHETSAPIGFAEQHLGNSKSALT